MRRLTSGVDGKPENCSRPLHPDQWMLIARAERHVEDAPAAPAPSLKTQHAAFHDELKALIQRLGFESTVALVTDWGYREPGERKLFAEFTCAAPVRQRRVVLWDHLHVAEEALTHLADWRNELGDAAMQRRAP
jgi:hypothetical protein